jgi:hypothetical protein
MKHEQQVVIKKDKGKPKGREITLMALKDFGLIPSTGFTIIVERPRKTFISTICQRSNFSAVLMVY